MKNLTTGFGAPVVDNQNIQTAGPRAPALLQDVGYQENLAHFDREVIPERRMRAKGAGADGTFTLTHDITAYTKATLFAQVGRKTDMFVRFSTVAGERGAADAERDIRGIAMKFYTEEGNWDLLDKMTAAQRAALFDNTARAISGAYGQVKARHIENCTRCEAAYGAGVGEAIARLGAAQA